MIDLKISDMISRRRYEVRRGETLSELAESFQREFPTSDEVCFSAQPPINKIINNK
ncbi:MAG: hypothetical protein ACRCTQ_03580 [Brevinemataceae bacterium]